MQLDLEKVLFVPAARPPHRDIEAEKRRALQEIRSQVADLTVLATAFAAIVIFIEVFFYRGGTFMHFMFGWRHGIALVLPLAIAVPYLLADERRVIRVVTAVAIVVTSGGVITAAVRRNERRETGAATERRYRRAAQPLPRLGAFHRRTNGQEHIVDRTTGYFSRVGEVSEVAHFVRSFQSAERSSRRAAGGPRGANASRVTSKSSRAAFSSARRSSTRPATRSRTMARSRRSPTRRIRLSRTRPPRWRRTTGRTTTRIPEPPSIR